MAKMGTGGLSQKGDRHRPGLLRNMGFVPIGPEPVPFLRKSRHRRKTVGQMPFWRTEVETGSEGLGILNCRFDPGTVHLAMADACRFLSSRFVSGSRGQRMGSMSQCLYLHGLFYCVLRRSQIRQRDRAGARD